jgi:hypothetical protein
VKRTREYDEARGKRREVVASARRLLSVVVRNELVDRRRRSSARGRASEAGRLNVAA